jgi:tetratricopeptide (TPR) repeat protein
MIAFLTTHLQEFPDDRNNGYYLTVVADVYQEQGADTLSRQYYRRALLSYPDITVRSVPVHRVAINRLLELVESPGERIYYLRYLQRRYPDEIDWGLTAYYLGKAYEAEARWSEAYESYRVFLRFPDTRVPGEPDAHELIRRQLAFYDSDRNWTYEDLDELVGNIKRALWTQNPALLLRNRAGKIVYTMFLRSSVWSLRIPTWYLYFRRIDFPADPAIHGNWEWAGIYFGESM